MKLPTFLAAIAWRPVIGLVVAGLLGWLAAWLMLTPGPLFFGGALTKANLALSDQSPASTPSLPGNDLAGPPQGLLAKPTFEQLLQQQEKISEGAARSTVPSLLSESASASMSIASKPVIPDMRETGRAEKIKAMRELQANALAEIQAVPPGDSKKMMVAMERFDAQMRAAGAPSIIDLDNMRKMLESSDRLQQLNRLLVTEAEKGRNADAVKVKAWAQEILTVQQAMPRQFIKADILKKQLTQ